MKSLAIATLAGAALCGAAPQGNAACEVASGPHTAALVELFTSEGCSSCPPADRALGSLPGSLGEAVVPLALHVGYWDGLGWRDPYAQDAFTQRQQWLANVSGASAVYTPAFFVNGREARLGSLTDRVRRLNAEPPLAALRLRAAAGGDTLTLSVLASTKPGVPDAALYVAVAESGLVSQVRAGENAGATLRHAHVVRQWLGPFSLHASKLEWQRDVPLAAGWKREQLEVAAFVQDLKTGRILQAVSASQCAGG